jgi:hypothetical protein
MLPTHPSFAILFRPFGFLVLTNFYIIWFSSLLTKRQKIGYVYSQKTAYVYSQKTGYVYSQTTGYVYSQKTGYVYSQKTGYVYSQKTGYVYSQKTGYVYSQMTGYVYSQKTGYVYSALCFTCFWSGLCCCVGPLVYMFLIRSVLLCRPFGLHVFDQVCVVV